MIAPMQELAVSTSDEGQRLDRYLRKLLATMPLSAIFKALRSGAIRIDGKKAKPDLRLAGMVLCLRLPPADLPKPMSLSKDREAGGRRPSAPRAGDRGAAGGGPLRILYRDQDMMVVDKPAGMPSQPGSGSNGDDLCSRILAAMPELATATFRPAPVHRLDKETSGLVAVGLSPQGLRRLSAAMQAGAVRKVYVAVVHGRPEADRGLIDAPLAVVDAKDKRSPKVRVAPQGQEARTEYEVLQVGPDRALLRLVLHTGRMHQIRAHLAHLGCPIWGDVRYGSKAKAARGLLLHATELVAPHPVTGQPIVVHSPPPRAFAIVPADRR